MTDNSELVKAAEELLDALTNQFMLWEESWDLYGEYFDCEPQWAVKIKMNQLREVLDKENDDF